MSFGIGIAYDMNIVTHIKVLSNLLFYNMNIRSVTYSMNICICCRLNSYIRMGIRRSRHFMSADFWIYLMCKVVLLLRSHGVPFICSIGIVNTTMPYEHATRANLCTSCCKSFAERHVIMHLGYGKS